MSSEPDYKALYFELAHQVSTVERTKAAAFDGQADGKQFWEAQGRLDALVGAALSWESDPDLYAELLARRQQREEDLPFLAFSNEELEDALPVDVGDQITCNRCSETHILEDADPPGLLMFVRCSGAAYLAAVSGKLVIDAPIVPKE